MENLGFTRVDVKNRLYTKRSLKVHKGTLDAACIAPAMWRLLIHSCFLGESTAPNGGPCPRRREHAGSEVIILALRSCMQLKKRLNVPNDK
jgi:hypothetical protein